MKVGMVAPTKMLNRYCKTKIHYCIPSLLEDEPPYREFYENLPRGSIKILDCRKLGWKGDPEDLDLCQEVYHKIKPKHVIFPSYMFDHKRTIEIAEVASLMFPPNASRIACVEGTTKEEILECAEWLRGFEGYAIPSHLYNICKEIPWSPLTIYIENHLRYDELGGLNGILITSLPIRLGLQGRLLSDYLPSPPSLGFDEEEDNYPMIVERNIEECLEFYDEV